MCNVVSLLNNFFSLLLKIVLPFTAVSLICKKKWLKEKDPLSEYQYHRQYFVKRGYLTGNFPVIRIIKSLFVHNIPHLLLLMSSQIWAICIVSTVYWET